MSGNNSSKENQDRQFDEEQYQMLRRCSKKRDITEWNEWRKANQEKPILLEGADLYNVDLGKAILDGANLSKANINKAFMMHAEINDANLTDAKLVTTNLAYTQLCGANLTGAEPIGANFEQAELDGAILVNTKLNGADLREATINGTNLMGADLTSAILENATLIDSNLENAKLLRANLKNANLRNANLTGADFTGSNLEGAEIWKSTLNNSIFKASIVDGRTLIWDCEDCQKADFTGVGLDSARVNPILKEQLKGNIRKIQWCKWYEAGTRWQRYFKNLIVKPFWWISDYGRSTTRIIGWFFGLSFMFALLYLICGLIDGQGVVANLFVDHNNPSGNAVHVRPLVVPFRALYFSIVTMTTLGFGDMYAYADSVWGHIFLMFQVLLGYILLGALVTRLAVLFTSSGPAMTVPKVKGKTEPQGQ